MSLVYKEILKSVINEDVKQLREIMQRRNTIESLNLDDKMKIIKSAIEKDFIIVEILAYESERDYEKSFQLQLLEQCIERKKVSYFERLVKKTDSAKRRQISLWDIIGQHGRLVLFERAMARDPQFVNIIFNVSDHESKVIILMQGVCMSKYLIVKQILEDGFHPNVVHGDFHPANTPLHIACCNNDLDMVKLLIRYSVYINMDIKDLLKFRTPLSMAAEYGCVEICKCLLDNGALVNVQDQYLDTPLHRVDDAFVRQVGPCLAITKLLVEAGCCINVVNAKGDIPLKVILYDIEYCRDHNPDPEVAVFLIKHGSNVNNIDDEDIVKKLFTSQDNIFITALRAGLKVDGYECDPQEIKYYRITKILENHQQNRLKLKYWCRLAIRQRLINVGNGSSIYPRVESLLIPSFMKSYLKLDT